MFSIDELVILYNLINGLKPVKITEIQYFLYSNTNRQWH